MAGIGFELRKLMRRDNITGFLRAYLYAAVIGSGPWVLSIVGMALIGALNLAATTPQRYLLEFQVTWSYIVVVSLSMTGLLQLAFTRYISDQLFLNAVEEVVPLFHGALLVVTVSTGLLGLAAVIMLFPDQSILYKLLAVAGLVIESNIWIAVILLSGLREYGAIVWLFGIGYAISALAAVSLRTLGLEGVLFGFVLGQLVLLVGSVGLVIRNFPAERFISLKFLTDPRLFQSLVLTGFFYILAVWIDKLIFWHTPETSIAIIGPLRGSPVYDFPIFLAHLSIIPGMAVFLMRMETDFVEHYERFYETVRTGGTLQRIEHLRNEMVRSAKNGIYELIKIQALSGLALIVGGAALLEWLNASPLHLPVLGICVLAASLQTVLMGMMNVLLYFDKRRETVIISGTLLVSNVAFTAASIAMGPRYYGIGFALALLVTCVLSFVLLDRRIERLEFETFMLQ